MCCMRFGIAVHTSRHTHTETHTYTHTQQHHRHHRRHYRALSIMFDIRGRLYVCVRKRADAVFVFFLLSLLLCNHFRVVFSWFKAVCMCVRQMTCVRVDAVRLYSLLSVCVCVHVSSIPIYSRLWVVQLKVRAHRNLPHIFELQIWWVWSNQICTSNDGFRQFYISFSSLGFHALWIHTFVEDFFLLQYQFEWVECRQHLWTTQWFGI